MGLINICDIIIIMIVFHHKRPSCVLVDFKHDLCDMFLIPCKHFMAIICTLLCVTQSHHIHRLIGSAPHAILEPNVLFKVNFELQQELRPIWWVGRHLFMGSLLQGYGVIISLIKYFMFNT